MRRFGIIYVALALLILTGILDADAGGGGVGWKGGKPTDTTVMNATSGSGTGLSNIESAAATFTALTATALTTPRYIAIMIDAPTVSATAGDGKATIPIPSAFEGYLTTNAAAYVTYTGTKSTATLDIEVNVKNALAQSEVTAYSISVGSDTFYGTSAVGSDAYFVEGDYIQIDVTSIQDVLASKGLMIYLEISPPGLP